MFCLAKQIFDRCNRDINSKSNLLVVPIKNVSRKPTRICFSHRNEDSEATFRQVSATEQKISAERIRNSVRVNNILEKPRNSMRPDDTVVISYRINRRERISGFDRRNPGAPVAIGRQS